MDRLERATYWRGHVDAWRQTDLTQIAHCAGQGLNPKAFYRWRRKFEAEHTAAGERLTLLPVRVERWASPWAPAVFGCAVRAAGWWSFPRRTPQVLPIC